VTSILNVKLSQIILNKIWGEKEKAEYLFNEIMTHVSNESHIYTMQIKTYIQQGRKKTTSGFLCKIIVKLHFLETSSSSN
jgi:hypothetical protein